MCNIYLLYVRYKLNHNYDFADEFVAFSAKMTTVQASNWTTMIFTETLINVGDAYSTPSGIFTAPTTGLYHFNGCFCAKQLGNKVKYLLMAEDNQTFRGEMNLQSNVTECSSFGHVVNMNKHGKVYITASYSHTETDIFNMFSGILIRKTH